MTITVVGSGYVGLVAGACFADIGNDVICLDTNEGKVAQLRAGIMPIFEPGLESLIQAGVAAGRLRFTSSYDEATAQSSVFVIAVGTPPNEDGSADLKYVVSAAQAIGERIKRPVIIINKSTVPVGTAAKVQAVVANALSERGLDFRFAVVSNPEFLKEGAAIQDFMRPDRIVIGSSDNWAIEQMRRLYAPLNRNHDKIIVMDAQSAELTKYAANAMLATRISFMNELAGLSEAVGADIELVRRGIGSDPRIGSHFLYAGAGYGGSCFPKDVRALMRTASEQGAKLGVLQAVEAANERQKQSLFEKICSYYGGREKLAGKTVAVWGLAFKPNTDDMREAPSVVLIRQLLASHARVRAYDPVAKNEAQHVLGQSEALAFSSSAEAAIEGSDVLVIVTEWREFRSPDFETIATHLRDKAVFDGRNIYDRSELQSVGLKYFDIGRNPVEVNGA